MKASGRGKWKRPDIVTRFFARVNKTDGCWYWTGSKIRKGYGGFFLGRDATGQRYTVAHRFSYTHHKGEIPAGLIVMHICDTPACVNPDHLRVGTNRENTHDMITKGRHPWMRKCHPVTPSRRKFDRRVDADTHCLRGHPWADHAFTNSRGYRECRVCARAYQKRYRDGMKALVGDTMSSPTRKRGERVKQPSEKHLPEGN